MVRNFALAEFAEPTPAARAETSHVTARRLRWPGSTTTLRRHELRPTFNNIEERRMAELKTEDAHAREISDGWQNQLY